MTASQPPGGDLHSQPNAQTRDQRANPAKSLCALGLEEPQQAGLPELCTRLGGMGTAPESRAQNEAQKRPVCGHRPSAGKPARQDSSSCFLTSRQARAHWVAFSQHGGSLSRVPGLRAALGLMLRGLTVPCNCSP